MEASREYLTWMKKRKQIMLRSQERTSSTWEERAFAEDAARILGGCIWPPRSYSCTFCKREFRSAQALGGHMNVHRRDRARLKQQTLISPKPDREVTISGGYREEHFKGFSQSHHGNHVDTGLSMGLLPTEEAMNCKRPKIAGISSVLPVILKPCSNDQRGLVFQSADMVLGVTNKPKMEDLDLELRLGKPQKVK